MKVVDDGGSSGRAIITNGFRVLSHINFVSISVTVAATLLGLTGFVFAIKDGKLNTWFSDTQENREKKKLCLVVPGLQNLGNNCFLNVILQALASCLFFKSFLQNVIEEECALLEQGERLPFTTTLAALLEDLSAVYEQRVVLSPRKVMLALVLYVENFNLTSQQDAAEAFLHLLYSLREEFSYSYLKSQGSLADVTASSCLIVTPRRMSSEDKQERWLQLFVGPFDGVLGSILTCQSCSTQISLDFQFFHTLPLSVISSGSTSTVLLGFTLEDSLRDFIGVEQVESYRCSHCWHIAAVKYLSTIGSNETEVEKLRTCGREDSCTCPSLSCLEKLPWSNNFSQTLKQLTIARSPKILCFHLQRASMNVFGELVKLQGHIAFPLILNLSPYMTTGVGIKHWEENVHGGHANSQFQKFQPIPNHLNLTYHARMFNGIYGLNSRLLVPNETSNMDAIRGGKINLIESEVSHDTMCTNTSTKPDSKESIIYETSPSMYRLASVVEHFGKVGSGHYTVYRRVQAESDHDECVEPALPYWFSISDSEVQSVSVKDVLAAEASLLFYERIGDD